LSNDKKNIVFVGSSGQLGSYFNFAYSSEFNLTLINKNNFEYMIEQATSKNMRYDSVIFAAQSSDYKESLFVKSIFNSNLTSLNTCLNVFAGISDKFLFFSSGSVYDYNNNTTIDERTDINYASRNPYVISKIMSELMLDTFADAYKSIYILRPFFMYSKFQSQQMLFKQLIEKIQNNKQIFLNNEGGLAFNAVHVSDVSRILTHLVGKNENENLKINICSKETILLADVIQFFEKKLCKKANILHTGEPLKKFIATSQYDYIDDYIDIYEGLGEYFEQ
jgi:nucleoside-diphosphate-sugar epimerase